MRTYTRAQDTHLQSLPKVTKSFLSPFPLSPSLGAAKSEAVTFPQGPPSPPPLSLPPRRRRRRRRHSWLRYRKQGQSRAGGHGNGGGGGGLHNKLKRREEKEERDLCFLSLHSLLFFLVRPPSFTVRPEEPSTPPR